jgi:hypothetical protein
LSALANVALFVVCMFAAGSGASAAVISSTPTLPVLGVTYAGGGVGCFPAAGVCIDPGTFTPLALVSSTFNATGQDIVTTVSYTGMLTTLTHAPLGPITLLGTLEQEVVGRTFSTELGTWETDLVALDLSGPLLGHTLTVGLDPANPSTGSTSVLPFATNNFMFEIDSFFDVFVELSLDTPTPLHTQRGPIHAALVAPAAVAEPGSLALMGLGIALFAFGRRRKWRY